MNFLIIFSQQLIGRGPFKNAYDMYKFINERTKHNAVIVENTDGAKKKNIVEGVEYLSFSKDIDELKKHVDNCDIILNYLFLNYKSSQEEINKYVELLDYMKQNNKKHVFFQFCHTNSRNELWKVNEYNHLLEDLDAVVSFSDNDGTFLKFCEDRKIKIKNLITMDKKLPLVHGIDFDSLKYLWKPFSEKMNKSVKFIGSNVSIKGPWKVRDFHWKYLKDAGYITSMEGFDNSIGILKDLYKMDREDWMKHKVKRDDVEICTTKRDSTPIYQDQTNMKRNTGIYVLPKYKNLEGLERMSKTQFGIEFVQGREDELKTIFENAMMEIIAVGTVPIFGKRWSEHFILNGKKLTDYNCEEIGTVIIDENNPDISLINELSKNSELYEKYRNNAFNFYKKHLDIEVINNEIIRRVINI